LVFCVEFVCVFGMYRITLNHMSLVFCVVFADLCVVGMYRITLNHMSLVFCVEFVDLFFFWLLCCLFFFDIRILITTLVSSNSFYLFVRLLMKIVHINISA
jgi:hypothetical protein